MPLGEQGLCARRRLCLQESAPLDGENEHDLAGARFNTAHELGPLCGSGSWDANLHLVW